MPSLAPWQPPSGAHEVPSRRRRCHAMPGTLPYQTLPRAAGCTVHVSAHMPHARRVRPLHAHPVPRACRPAPILRTVFTMRTGLTRPSPRSVFSLKPRQPPKLGRRHASRALHFPIPFGFGRPRKPWPTCHCALRCACTAGTTPAHSTTGHTPGCSSGTKLRVL